MDSGGTLLHDFHPLPVVLTMTQSMAGEIPRFVVDIVALLMEYYQCRNNFSKIHTIPAIRKIYSQH